jgi:indolepyruvate ferredoxin oxidoreductase
VPESIRGYGHVKHANVVAARARWAALLDEWNGRTPQRPRVIELHAA